MVRKKQFSSSRNTKSKVKKHTLIILLLIGLLGSSAFLIYNYTSKNDQVKVENSEDITREEPINYDPPSEKQIESQDQEKTELPKNSGDTVDNSPLANSEVIISSAKQELSNVVIMTKLVGNSWDSCELVLSQGTVTIGKTSETIYQESFSTCLGFDIEVNDFPTGGTWQINLSASKINGQNFTSEVKTIEVIK